MFNGNSAKKGNHGYGLPSLSKLVAQYDGHIFAECDYDENYKSHYLTFTLEFEDDEQKQKVIVSTHHQFF